MPFPFADELLELVGDWPAVFDGVVVGEECLDEREVGQPALSGDALVRTDRGLHPPAERNRGAPRRWNKSCAHGGDPF